MLKNYFTIAYRNLIHNKLYTVIGIAGLSIALACCIIIFLFVQHEFSYDKFHDNADNLYRVLHMEYVRSEVSEGSTSTGYILRGELKDKYPEVVGVTRMLGFNAAVSRTDGNSFFQDVYHVDPDFFLMYSFPLVKGDKNTVFNDPGAVVLTEEMARKYFSDEDPLGKPMKIQLGEKNYDFTVSGVIEKAPVNSSIQYDLLISVEQMKNYYPENYLDSWNLIYLTTYVQLKPGTDVSAFSEKVSANINSLFDNEEDRRFYRFQPFMDIHTNPDYDGESVSSTDPMYSYILIAIAASILLIACINFVTLSIGRAGSRVREVGLRKVVGAFRGQIMGQYWCESLVLCLIALVVGIILVELFLPVFNDLARKQLSFDLFSQFGLVPVLFGIVLLTSFLAGIYPSLYLSKFLPVETLRREVKIGGKNILIQALVVLQFTISIFLICSTFIMSSQVDYINNARLGYDKDFVVNVRTGSTGEDATRLLDRYRAELAGQPSIVDVAGYAYSIGESWLYLNLSAEEGATVLIGEDLTQPGWAQDAADTGLYFYLNWVDPHYIPAMKLNLVEGRNFMENHPADVDGAIIINQTLARKLGYDHPVGEKLPRGFRDAVIVGVVEDFHFYPLHRHIEPLVFHMPRNDNMGSTSEIAVRISPDNIPATLSLLENKWSLVSDGKPFIYEFLDDKVTQQYLADQRWRKIVLYSSIMSIMITCFGLFGLASLSVVKRTREIGIRKVFGATVNQITAMFTLDFTKYILIAVAVALPTAYLVMKHWLASFAFRTPLSWYYFVFAALTALAIAVIAVFYQALKAALTNPADCLRGE
ncbi:MAG: ABC transporter permease [candidate division Zixibacteria bacterium]|nr:ABC transporter permease [candidate division Zixibacteria bacterium]